MVLARKARLLPASSHDIAPSSKASFQAPTANLTDSIVSLLFSTTVLPSASTSLPPHDHKYGYQKAGPSPKACASVWPSGRFLALSFLPTARYSSQFLGKFSRVTPSSANHEVRLTNSTPRIV